MLLQHDPFSVVRAAADIRGRRVSGGGAAGPSFPAGGFRASRRMQGDLFFHAVLLPVDVFGNGALSEHWYHAAPRKGKLFAQKDVRAASSVSAWRRAAELQHMIFCVEFDRKKTNF